jgi:hypothetical protein
MPAVPAITFLAAAVLCSVMGRILLVTAAFGVSTGWGLTVLFAPFGPLIFRMQHREKALSTRYWRMAVGPLLVAFFATGGSIQSVRSSLGLDKPAPVAQASTPAPAGNPLHLPVPGKVVAAAMAKADTAAAKAPFAAATPAPGAVGKTAASTGKPAATPAPTPTMAVVAAASAMPAAPAVLSPAERTDANRREFERLAEWYDNLKHERGYLRKGDTEGVVAYNVEAAKYQAALQLANTEKAALSKLTAKK